jgi:hypothetical protein
MLQRGHRLLVLVMLVPLVLVMMVPLLHSPSLYDFSSSFVERQLRQSCVFWCPWASFGLAGSRGRHGVGLLLRTLVFRMMEIRVR